MNVRPASRRAVTRAATVALVMGLIVSAAACSSSSSASQSAAPTGESELSIGSFYSPVNLDPAQASGIAQTQPYLSPVYDQLMQLDEEGKVVPMLAKSWKFREDGSALDLELRDDVTFSDGTPFNAEAVKANLERYMTKAVPAVQTLLKSLDSIEVTGEYSVSLKLKDGGGAELPDALAASPGYMVSPKALNNPDLDVKPVGSGPYQVESFKPGSSITYVKRGGEYWGGKDVYRIHRLKQFGFTDPNAGYNALRSGEIDMLVLQVSDRIDEFKNDSRFNVTLSPTRGYYQIRLNMENPALADVRVRQAIAYALDRKAIGEVATGTPDGCKPSAQPLSALGADPALDDAYPYDPAKAKELLAEAGHPSLNLKGMYVENKLSQVVQSQLKEVGINVEFTATTPEQYINEWNSKKYDITPGSTTLRYQGDILYRYIDEPTLLGETPKSVRTAAEGMYDPKKSDDERIKQWQEVSKEIVDQVSGATIICHTMLAVVADAKVKGYDKIPGIWRGSYDAKNLSLG